MAENLDSDRKQHLISLQDIDKMRNLWKELKILVDEDLIRFETDEPPDWKVHAIRNIGNIKDRLQKANTSVHEHLLEEIQDVDINDLTYDDPLANGIVDLESSQYQLVDDDYDVLVGEKGGIRNLRKEMTRHKHWVEGENDRAQIATNITDILLQETKRNICKIFKSSENALVDVVERLIEASIYQMPIDFDIEVTRNERQSDASKKRKNRQVPGSRGNMPDLMIRAFFKQKWNEIAYVESGKWLSTGTKPITIIIKEKNIHIAKLDDDIPPSRSLNSKPDYKHCVTADISDNTSNSNESNNTSVSDISANASVQMCRLTPNSNDTSKQIENKPSNLSYKDQNLESFTILQPISSHSPLIQELRIEPLEEDTVKMVNVDKNFTDNQSPAIKLVYLFERICFVEFNTMRAKQDEIVSWYSYRKYKKKTGLDPWINSESSQIEKTDNYLLQDCVIKIFKFLEEKDVIIETVHKRFPFLSYTNSNTWHRDVFKYTDSEAKCPICKESLPEIQVSVLNKTHLYQPEASLHQYAIKHGMDSKNFLVITEVEKNRRTMGYFRSNLKRDIRYYHGGIKRNEDTRKYQPGVDLRHKFLTDQERLIGEELLRCSIVKSGLSTA
ncbi:3456_t:CDS:10 [Diversispora eburnea]|uniref:3456_t:CDS:1 n=1 Tax=Diversispora eburnea TaxID=1213867 RepID=A0A9N9CHN5_9GLOM|nr:3456_t:CDS:10 [Diversispora eburnea]